MDHDHSYKLLFSHPEMVADLLRGFVLEDWVKDIPGGTPSTSLAFGWDVLYWISPNSNGTFPISPVDFDNLNELQEVKSMLAERVIEWTEEWEQQGLQSCLGDQKIDVVVEIKLSSSIEYRAKQQG